MLGYKLFQNPNKYSQSWNFGPKGSQVKTVKKLVHDMNFYLKPYKIKMNTNKNYKKFKEAKLLKLDSNKASRLLKWECKWSMDQAIQQTTEWYKFYLLKKDTKILIKKQIEEYFFN